MARKSPATLTPWWAGRYKPKQKGVYQRKGPSIGIIYSRWDGHYWMIGHISWVDALGEATISTRQQLAWRGLADEPK